MRTADDIITAVTEAASVEAAQVVLTGVPRALLLETADQLFIDADGKASATLRKAIIAEARA